MAKQKRKKKSRGQVHSPLGHHKVIGKRLVPPLNAMPLTSHTSWRDDHAPEMLWAFLLAAVLPREAYLGCFRSVLNWAHANLKKESPASSVPPPNTSTLGMACELDITALSALPDEQFTGLFEILVRHPLSYGALRPLLLIESLPGRDRWRHLVGVDATEHDWNTLARAVAHSLDHQSEVSTDIRWLKVMTAMALDRLRMPREMVLNLIGFPNVGDLRAVRPSIRSLEITMRRQPIPAWIERYWSELLNKTRCIDGFSESEYFDAERSPLPLRAILDARRAVIERFHALKTSTRVDARFDSTFGFCLNALSILEEVSAPPISQLVTGRLGLRTLAEIVITFSYLIKVDDAKRWATYRNYGSGQAKLAFLKLEETAGEAPKFVDQETLEALANEDLWQEFVDIDLGHWAGKNLRDLAIEGGTKDVYDSYYSWTSTFTHSQWCAVRDSNFTTCHNMLHRLHRIPRPHHRLLPSVVPDAARLTNRILGMLEVAFPGMEPLARFIAEKDAASPPQTAVAADATDSKSA